MDFIPAEDIESERIQIIQLNLLAFIPDEGQYKNYNLECRFIPYSTVKKLRLMGFIYII